tara:strand:- start:20812 stop:21285 length:474 start_codon:yes stop_codon:yes gene_type:complete
MSDFSHLKQYEPGANTATLHLPIDATLKDGFGKWIDPTMTMRAAGQSNAAYFDAISRINTKTGQTRRLAQGKIDAKSVENNRRNDRALFPRHVIVGWAGIAGGDGTEVTFSQDACKAFLNALPAWIMDEIRNFAAVPENFLPDTAPTQDEVDETAKN